MRYFAYGTNMNPAVMANKQLTFSTREPARLEGYGLRFDKQSRRERLPAVIGFANIAESTDERVEGALYTLDDADAERLDRLEKCPEHYERLAIEVSVGQGRVACFTYRARPELTAQDLLPSRNYINHILAASDLLSPAYREQLEGLETYSGECATCHRQATLLFVPWQGRLFALCAPCREARRMWGDTLGRELSVLDTEAVMQHVMRSQRAYTSIGALLDDVIGQGLLAPRGS